MLFVTWFALPLCAFVNVVARPPLNLLSLPPREMEEESRERSEIHFEHFVAAHSYMGEERSTNEEWKKTAKTGQEEAAQRKGPCALDY